ncbi:uncharacterized protein Hap1MRO34_022747 isoform 2-T2 [Clarias gariepinus]
MQWMYGCQLHDNGTTRGYNLYSYDGTDFLFLDMSTLNWHAANEKAELFKNKWDTTGQEATHMSNYLDNKCIKSLKEYVSLLNTLQSSRRKVCPKVSLFLKHSSSPEVVCHATGFFSKPLNMTWQKDGEDVHEDVELSKTLPNQDGSFQKRCILKVPAKELKKHNYTCVVQHSSLEKEIVLPVSQTPRACNIRYNVTVVILRATITELTADVLVDGVRFFRYPANITEEKMEDDLLKSRVQRVEGYKGDLNSFLSAIMKDFNHTKGSLQWLVACDGNNVSLTKGYMKFICGKNFITFQSKKENWTLSDDQAIVIKRSLNPEYAQNAKTILQEECAYWDNQYARDNHERKDNYSPQNITAIPPGTTSTVSDMDREQFTSRVTTKKTESDDKGLDGKTVAIIIAVVVALVAVPAGIVVWKNSGERSEELNIRYNRANSASGEDSLSFKGNEKNSVLNIKD